MTAYIYAGLYDHRAQAFMGTLPPPEQPFAPTPTEVIIATVCEYMKVTPTDLKCKSRKRDKVEARQIAMHFFIEKTRMSLKAIGKEFGGRDHSTVIYARDTVSDLMDTDKSFKAKVEEIAELLKN